MTSSTFAERLAEARKAAGLSQRALAARLGMSSAYVSELERGGVKMIRGDLVPALGEALTVPGKGGPSMRWILLGTTAAEAGGNRWDPDATCGRCGAACEACLDHKRRTRRAGVSGCCGVTIEWLTVSGTRVIRDGAPVGRCSACGKRCPPKKIPEIL